MYPILFEIPGLGLPIRSFGVMVVLGFLLASHLVTRWYLDRSDDPERDAPGIQALPLWVMAGVVTICFPINVYPLRGLISQFDLPLMFR